MKRSVFFAGVTITVIVAIIVGIITIGGPYEGRREVFDRHRYEDLNRISTALHCRNWRILQPTLPETLSLASIRAYCGGVEIQADVLLDNETGQPYTYTRISETEYSVCAEFYSAEKTMNQNYPIYWGGYAASFNPDTGCVTGRIG